MAGVELNGDTIIHFTMRFTTIQIKSYPSWPPEQGSSRHSVALLVMVSDGLVVMVSDGLGTGTRPAGPRSASVSHGSTVHVRPARSH